MTAASSQPYIRYQCNEPSTFFWDIIAMATNPVFAERHEYKMAVLTKTIAFPVEPLLHLGDVRILFGLLLFSLFSLLDMLIF